MFRFAIRDVLWLTVVVAMAVGWWVDHRLLTTRDWLLVKDGRYTTAGLRPGDKLEFEILPNGEIGRRIIPAK